MDDFTKWISAKIESLEDEILWVESNFMDGDEKLIERTKEKIKCLDEVLKKYKDTTNGGRIRK